MKVSCLLSEALIILGLSSCTEKTDERHRILADYGVNNPQELSIQELKGAMAEMLPDAGSVNALEERFKYIFENQPETLQSLAGEFARYHEITSSPTRHIEEIKRLYISGDNKMLMEFWLDQLAIMDDLDTHYVVYIYEDGKLDIVPNHLIKEAKHDFVEGQIDLAQWYLERNMKGDIKKAYDWLLKAQSLGENLTDEIMKVEKRLSANSIR